MAKQKKTLEQKKKSDKRKHTPLDSSHPTGLPVTTTFSLSGYTFSSPNQKNDTTQHSSFSLTHGLEKTLIVSSVIVILQLAIFFLLTHHILILPGKVIQY